MSKKIVLSLLGAWLFAVGLSAQTFGGSPIGGGGGGPTTPGSTTDNAFVRWDGTGGTALQNGQTVEDDSGNVTFAGRIVDTTAAPASAVASGSAYYLAGTGVDTTGEYLFYLGEDGNGPWLESYFDTFGPQIDVSVPMGIDTAPDTSGFANAALAVKATLTASRYAFSVAHGSTLIFGSYLSGGINRLRFNSGLVELAAGVDIIPEGTGSTLGSTGSEFASVWTDDLETDLVTAPSGNLTVTGSLRPDVTGSRSLGTSTLVYTFTNTQTIRNGTSGGAADLTIADNAVPDVDSTRSLGASANEWLKVWTDTIGDSDGTIQSDSNIKIDTGTTGEFFNVTKSGTTCMASINTSSACGRGMHSVFQSSSGQNYFGVDDAKFKVAVLTTDSIDFSTPSGNINLDGITRWTDATYVSATPASLPTCDSLSTGSVIFQEDTDAAAGEGSLCLCRKNAGAGTYAWESLNGASCT